MTHENVKVLGEIHYMLVPLSGDMPTTWIPDAAYFLAAFGMKPSRFNRRLSLNSSDCLVHVHSNLDDRTEAASIKAII